MAVSGIVVTRKALRGGVSGSGLLTSSQFAAVSSQLSLVLSNATMPSQDTRRRENTARGLPTFKAVLAKAPTSLTPKLHTLNLESQDLKHRTWTSKPENAAQTGF